MMPNLNLMVTKLVNCLASTKYSVSEAKCNVMEEKE
jgi:hypothetical protein